MRNTIGGLLGVLLLASVADAQGVAPPRYTDHWGWAAADLPVGRSWARHQVLIDRSSLPRSLRSGATISAIGVRRAARDGGAYTATTIDTEISVFSTPQAVDAMSQTFADNRAMGTGGVAFTRKTLNLPAADFGNPNDFVTIPLDQPHNFAGPNLLIEFSNVDVTPQSNGWLADTVGTRADGATTVFGVPCGPTTNSADAASAAGFLPGTAVDFTLNGGPPNGAAALLIGLGCVELQGVPLPLDTAFFTSPGCKLHVALDATTARAIDASGQAVATLPIPADLALNNQHFYTQWLDLDAGATTLAFSDARQVHVGPIFDIKSASTSRRNDNLDTVGDPIVRDRMPIFWLSY